MANLSKTWKAQKLNVFGPSLSTTWGTGGHGTMTWGVSTWGMKAAGVSGTPGIYKSVGKSWTGSNKATVLDAVSKGVSKKWSKTNAVAASYANSGKYLRDSSGFFYVFKGTNPNIEQEPINFTYTKFYAAVSGASGYTTYTVSAASWVTSVTF